jgi:predicted dienelactone hydrolase
MTALTKILAWMLYVAITCFVATTVRAAGIRFIDVPANGQQPPLTGVVWYPCASPVQDVRLHGLKVPGVIDCPIEGDRYPLVIISHGRTGWYGGHHDTAEVLADGGFVVVAINHPGENAFDRSRVDELSLAAERPVDNKRVIDFMLDSWPDRAKIDQDHIAEFGFSRGGYTTLAVIGGTPDYRRGAGRCPRDLNEEQCNLFRKYEVIPERRATYDPRIKAAVIADPANSILFGEDDLKGISVPVQVWASGRGGAGVSVQSVGNVLRKLPAGTEYHLVPDAGHFAFLAPCTAGQMQSNPDICVDAPGFDRIAFHKMLNAEILAFFRQHLLQAHTGRRD